MTAKQRKYLPWAIGLLLVAVILLVWWLTTRKGRSGRKSAINDVWDPVSIDRIKTLDERLQPNAAAFINEMEQKHGIYLRVVQALRTFEEQDRLYQQGRTTPGSIVTNAPAGHSYHNYGLAFDVVPIVNGAADWDTPHWDLIGKVGKSYGFEWGGDWTTILDRPHFQQTYGKHWSELINQAA